MYVYEQSHWPGQGGACLHPVGGWIGVLGHMRPWECWMDIQQFQVYFLSGCLELAANSVLYPFKCLHCLPALVYTCGGSLCNDYFRCLCLFGVCCGG